MRRFLVPLVLVLTACQTQPHHDPPDAALLAEVRAGLEAELTRMGVDPLPSDRALTLQTGVLTNLARDAAPAWRALEEGRLTDDALRELGRDLVRRLPAVQQEPIEPPALLTALLAEDPPWTRAQRILVLGLLNRLCDQGPIVLSESEMRFFGRLPPERAGR